MTQVGLIGVTTEDRDNACSWLRTLLPDADVIDSPSCAGPFLDLVVAGVIRLADPSSGSLAYSKGPNWSTSSSGDVAAAGNLLFSHSIIASGCKRLKRKGL